jgi:aspartate racemase
MRTLGLIGGTSWHSTIEYYRNINQTVNEHFGDNTNPPIILFNLNQAVIHRYQIENEWDEIAKLVIDAAKRLERAGANAVLFCANTPHKIFEVVETQINIPILHIVDATAKAILERKVKKVSFIGTRFSMEEDFLTKRFAKKNIEVIMPEDKSVIIQLHRIIQKELTFGQVNDDSKRFVLDSIQSMIKKGAEGVVLGCTEFPLMIGESDLPVPIFNTTKIHSKAASDYILMTND